MTTREMHYDFKQKFNKIDSQKNKGLLVPEIDWLLNEAAELFVKKVATPKFDNVLGFETSQRVTEDIKTIVVGGTWLPVTNNIITFLYRILKCKKNMRCITKNRKYHARNHKVDKCTTCPKSSGGLISLFYI